MIVVDASVVAELVLRTPRADVIEARLFAEGEALTAPELVDVEVAQVIRRSESSGDLDETRGQEAIDDLKDFPLARYPHTPLLTRVWELRENLTAYDAVYVALAEVLEIALVTCDGKISRAPGVRAPVEVL